ncbi:MAG: Stf0 family sulfotransferase [Cypionkella sp.]|uniref:Stf0 family sulfotransferase n=1 Tax=Cypionkella sp. TaxID=2811411 RepID=UPI002AB96F1D|nr:Stf0 family sulfotransferase [Cypionkella sp.]MDZ4311915.1 Stf0 family sulfotransferase [Cypionkella sp.]
MKSYIICGTPRSGSTLLCDLLAATQVAGVPDSFFMRDVDPVWARAWGLPARGELDAVRYAAGYLAAAITAGTGATGVFGLRLMRESLGDVLAVIDTVYPGLTSDRARLRAAFGEVLFVHLSRQDKLAQAVSLIKAEQTGLWHVAPDGSELERLSAPQEPRYDFARLRAMVAELQGYDAAWLDWFAEQGIVPLRVEYDSLSADPVAEVARICAALGVAAPVTGGLIPGVAKLADAVSADWMRQYRVDVAAQG